MDRGQSFTSVCRRQDCVHINIGLWTHLLRRDYNTVPDWFNVNIPNQLYPARVLSFLFVVSLTEHQQLIYKKNIFWTKTNIQKNKSEWKSIIMENYACMSGEVAGPRHTANLSKSIIFIYFGPKEKEEKNLQNGEKNISQPTKGIQYVMKKKKHARKNHVHFIAIIN